MRKNRIILWSTFGLALLILVAMVTLWWGHADESHWWALLSALLLVCAGVLWFNARKIKDHKALVRQQRAQQSSRQE